LELVRMTPTEFDTFCSKTPHILRSLRGHAFEVWFDDLMRLSGYECKKKGGDNVVDRVLNNHTLQLKTPYEIGTTNGEQVAYRMHKTHGAETYPDALYRQSEFADYLVGWHPDKTKGLVICPSKNLKTRAEINPKLKWGEYIADPVPFEWNTPWLNRWDLLGVDKTRLVFPDVESNKILPKTSRAVGFSDIEIIRAVVSRENFRVWQQLIVGSVREYHFLSYVEQNGVSMKEPTDLDTRGKEKVDYVYDGSGGRVRIQVKGLTRGICRGNILGCETQGSHSRKPTRYYRRSDFEVLAIVIDPGMIPPATVKKLGVDGDAYNFLFVRMTSLPLHEKSKEWGDSYIQPIYRFDVSKAKLNNIELLKNYQSAESSSFSETQSTL
jgi:hypothetical protein